MITVNEAIEAIADYCAVFTGNVPTSTRERWVNLLLDLKPGFQVLRKAIHRSAENDLSASWSRLRSAINIETSIQISKGENASDELTDDYRRWLETYKSEGLSRGYPPAPVEILNEPRTEERKARVCSQVIRDISLGRIRCPSPWDRHDISVDGDEEERWFWNEVERRLDEESA